MVTTLLLVTKFLEDRVRVTFSPAHPLGTFQTSETATGRKERTNEHMNYQMQERSAGILHL